jgi:hypothetical protein
MSMSPEQNRQAAAIAAQYETDRAVRVAAFEAEQRMAQWEADQAARRAEIQRAARASTTATMEALARQNAERRKQSIKFESRAIIAMTIVWLFLAILSR